VNLAPLGDRVLIQPDQVKAQTESGLHLIEHWPDEVSGVVAAVGRARHPRKAEAFELADIVERGCEHRGSVCSVCDSAQMLRDLTGREPSVSVGDRVIFSRAAGQEITIDDTRYFLMREADLLAVLEGVA
jgi:co-chaperonin GroES (HSP10)